MNRSPSLAERLSGSPFQSYVYSYPHKTTYRTLERPIPLREAWAQEDRSALFLYLHVPFCEQRCGFCNLFTQSQPPQPQVTAYLDALERQAETVAAEIQPQGIARMAVGGGTPTFLSPPDLDRLFRIAAGLGASRIPCSVELSPVTASAERIAILRHHGVNRVSLGVQSTLAPETDALRRHQDPANVAAAITRLRAAGFPTVNADLMYGQTGQTTDSLTRSIDEVISWGANEVYLYPLYVRPLTILGRLGTGPVPSQPDLYLAGRDHLRALGWQQRSMRLFQAPDAPATTGPAYRCQEDGMIGLGPSARSYTTSLHYASSYAVGQAAIRDRITAWSAQTNADFAVIRHGFVLDAEDQRRRYAILSLLECGLDEVAYARRFGTTVSNDLPMLAEGLPLGVLAYGDGLWRLTDRGVGCADVIGRWLFSRRVEELMETWTAA